VRETFGEGVFVGEMVGEDGDLGPRVQRAPSKDCYPHSLPDAANRRRSLVEMQD
jgi:hypothetical protein